MTSYQGMAYRHGGNRSSNSRVRLTYCQYSYIPSSIPTRILVNFVCLCYTLEYLLEYVSNGVQDRGTIQFALAISIPA
jgi:hypothetical protein